MVVLDVCNLCGGQGFVSFYHAHGVEGEEDRALRQCPSCQGAGWLEPWLQAATGLQTSWRVEEADLKALIRQRDDAE